MKFLKKVVGYLNWFEWIAYTVMITLIIWLPFYLDLVEGQVASFCLATLASTTAVTATVIVSKGSRKGILVDIIGLTAIGVNLIWFTPSPQKAIGWTFLLFTVPMMILTYYIWGQRKKKGVIEQRKLGALGWGYSFTLMFAISMVVYSVLMSINTDIIMTPVEHWNIIFESMAVGGMIVLTTLYAFAYREFWVWWTFLILINYGTYTTNWFIQPSATAINQFVVLTIELSLAFYGWYHWWYLNHKKKVKDHKTGLH